MNAYVESLYYVQGMYVMQSITCPTKIPIKCTSVKTSAIFVATSERGVIVCILVSEFYNKYAAFRYNFTSLLPLLYPSPLEVHTSVNSDC